jgi:hypothetical protein
MADSSGRKTPKSGSRYKCIEKNIYREYRGADSVRFKVVVYPLKAETQTVDRADERDGEDWAREERARLIKSKRTHGPQSKIHGPRPLVADLEQTPPTPASASPNTVRVAEILTHYETHCLPLLSTANSRAAEMSRLRKLFLGFGTLTLGGLTKAKLTEWKEGRFAGLYGGARSAWRERAHDDGAVLTEVDPLSWSADP